MNGKLQTKYDLLQNFCHSEFFGQHHCFTQCHMFGFVKFWKNFGKTIATVKANPYQCKNISYTVLGRDENTTLASQQCEIIFREKKVLP